MRLQQVDGGAGYYGQFTSGLSTSAGYFPRAVWGAYDFTAANVAKDKAVGLNLYVWNADPSASGQRRIAAAGMRTLQAREDGTTNIGAHTAGHLLADEVDMEYAPSQGLSVMQSAENQVLSYAGGRALYANYGKGVLFGWGNGTRISEADRARYVNDFQQLVSSDFYWFTDPWQSDTPAESWLPEHATEADGTISGSQVRRASNYGYQIDEMRRLDGLDGQRKPIWAFVEVGSPFTPGAGDEIVRAITPAQIRAAVWHSLIAGARGVIYFQHSFSGSAQTHHALRDPRYQPVIDMVKSVNAQIKRLARALNAPTVRSGWTATRSIRAMVKWYDGHLFVFAGSRNNVASTGAFAMPCVGDATAVRLGQPGSVAVTNGRFSDAFQDGNAVHIYRIDGGSDCGLPETSAGEQGTAGRVRVGRLPRQVSLRSRRLVIPVRCTAACTVRSRLTTRVESRRILLAAARRRLSAGLHRVVIRVSRRDRRRVAGGRPMRLRTSIVQRGARVQLTQRLVARHRLSSRSGA